MNIEEEERGRLIPENNPDKIGNMTYIFNKKRVMPSLSNCGGAILTILLITTPTIFYYCYV
jgi:hypothetical protein